MRLSRRFTPAVAVIIMFGLISMLGDMVYEGARSANAQYFNLLSVSATQVGLAFGVGEFLGYCLRLVSGILSDRSGRHWLFMSLGYGMLVVVPLIGFTTAWSALVALILMERIGKALRSPAKDTVLSAVAENQMGIGFAFGLQEFLDQFGAFVGPLVFTLVFYLTGLNGVAQYQLGYRLLVVPFVVLMLFVALAYRRVTRNGLIPSAGRDESRSEKLGPLFWVYTAFTFFCTLGFVNFSVVGYHLKVGALLSDGHITLLYAGAMAVDAVVALIAGKAYDRAKAHTGVRTGGLLVLLAIPLLTLLLPFLTLSNSTALVVIGMAVFGVVMGTHETVMRSAIADIAPFRKRGTGYGVFNASYGLALLGGAAVMGLLYDRNSIGAIAALTCVAEAVALILFVRMRRLAGTAQR